jgi:hypothetical protein
VRFGEFRALARGARHRCAGRSGTQLAALRARPLQYRGRGRLRHRQGGRRGAALAHPVAAVCGTGGTGEDA